MRALQVDDSIISQRRASTFRTRKIRDRVLSERLRLDRSAQESVTRMHGKDESPVILGLSGATAPALAGRRRDR